MTWEDYMRALGAREPDSTFAKAAAEIDRLRHALEDSQLQVRLLEARLQSRKEQDEAELARLRDEVAG